MAAHSQCTMVDNAALNILVHVEHSTSWVGGAVFSTASVMFPDTEVCNAERLIPTMTQY